MFALHQWRSSDNIAAMTQDSIQRGKRLQQLREQAGLSQDGLADAAKIGTRGKRNGARIGAWEDGGNGTVAGLLAIVGALAQSLGRSKADVLTYLLLG